MVSLVAGRRLVAEGRVKPARVVETFESTGDVAGTFTLTNYAGLRPTPEPVMRVDTGSVAGERSGIDIVLSADA